MRVRLTCSRTIVIDNLDEGRPEGGNVLTVHYHYLEAVSLERLCDVIAFEVLGGMSGNCDVIVIDEELHVEFLRDGQSGGFGVVTLLLGAIRAEQEHRLVPVGECDAVDEGPQVAETAGGELDSGSETKLRVTGQFGVGFAIMEEMLCGDMTFDRSDEILCRNTVSYSVC